MAMLALLLCVYTMALASEPHQMTDAEYLDLLATGQTLPHTHVVVELAGPLHVKSFSCLPNLVHIRFVRNGHPLSTGDIDASSPDMVIE